MKDGSSSKHANPSNKFLYYFNRLSSTILCEFKLFYYISMKLLAIINFLNKYIIFWNRRARRLILKVIKLNMK